MLILTRYHLTTKQSMKWLRQPLNGSGKILTTIQFFMKPTTLNTGMVPGTSSLSYLCYLQLVQSTITLKKQEIQRLYLQLVYLHLVIVKNGTTYN